VSSPPSELDRPSPSPRRFPIWAWVLGILLFNGALAVLVICALAGLVSWQQQQEQARALATAQPQAISAANAASMEQLARWGKGTVNQIAYSPDGSLLAVASSIRIYLYDAQTLEEVRFIEINAWVTSVAF